MSCNLPKRSDNRLFGLPSAEKQWSRFWVGEKIRKVLRELGFPWASSKTFRHSFISHLVMSGVLIVSVSDNESILPTDYRLYQNYPNPFNPTTTIIFQLPVASDVTIRVYNILGQQIKTLVVKKMSVGYHTIKWDGTSELGLRVSSGLYFYRIQAGEFSAVKKIIFIK